MHLLRSLLVLALVAVLASPGGAQTTKKAAKGKKYAFLVACSDYGKSEFRKLPGTVKEMKDFRQTLIDAGWPKDNIDFLHDDTKEKKSRPVRATILKTLETLLARLKKEDTLVVALNGHGLHFKKDKVGYFVPVDGELEKKSTLVPVDGKGGLFEKMKTCKAARMLFLINGSRNDPVAGFCAGEITIDDKDMDELPKGFAALYSCRRGEISYLYPEDARKGKPGRSLFYHHVIEAWKGKYSGGGKKVTVEHLFKEVRKRTAADADDLFEKSQIPHARRAYQGEWVINDRVKARSGGRSNGGPCNEMHRIHPYLFAPSPTIIPSHPGLAAPGEPGGSAATQHQREDPMADQTQRPAPQPEQMQAEIVLNEKDAHVAYSNFARVTSTAEEVIIDFCLNPNPFQAGRQEITVAQRLIMNFYTAKRLLSALAMTLQRHEQAFGQIELDIRRRAAQQPPPPGAPAPGVK